MEAIKVDNLLSASLQCLMRTINVFQEHLAQSSVSLSLILSSPVLLALSSTPLRTNASYAPVSHFSSSFDAPSCISCFKGCWGDYVGVDYQRWVPTPHEEYTDAPGSLPFTPSPNNTYWAVGWGGVGNKKYSDDEVGVEKLRGWNENRWLERRLMISFYAGGLLVGFVLAFLCVCLPTGKYFFYADSFKDQYPPLSLDPITQAGRKMLGRRRMGGLVGIVGLRLLMSGVVPLIVVFGVKKVGEKEGCVGLEGGGDGIRDW
jgi:hypothetical protein